MTGFERIVIQAASMGLASIMNRAVFEGGGRLLQWMRGLDETPERILARAAEQYVHNYAGRHGQLKVLGMREPVPLETIYTTVQFLDRAGMRWYDSIESLEQAYRRSGRRGFQPKAASRLDGITVANEKPYLMVLGGPGAGKSTFLRKIGLEALKGAQGAYLHECIPVLLELKNFANGCANLEEAIAQEFQICGFPSSDEATRKLLEAGKLLLLFDGLDEVPSKNTDEAICQIQDFVDRYDQNRFIISCRVAAYHHNFRRFSDVAMADFDLAQIQQFINNWFHSEMDRTAGTAQKCWELLHKPENAAAKELAHTPLLLTLLCLVYDHSQNFPTNRSNLYRKALRILLEEWAAEKRIMREEIYQGLNTELEEILLAEIAYEGFQADRLFFSKREIVGQIKEFLTNNLNAPRHLDGERILDAIAIQQGILVERAEDVFSFSHLTLQEYLTAQHLDDHHQVTALVHRHLTDERWQEVFLLVAGLMRSGADDLLVRMERRSRRFLQTPRLQQLLIWAETMTRGTGGSIPPAAKRAALLFLVTARDRALDVVRALDEDFARVLDLVQSLDLLRSPAAIAQVELARAMHQARTQDLTCVPDRPRSRNRPIARTPRSLAQAVTRALAREFEQAHLCRQVNFKALIARLEALKLKEPHRSQPQDAQQSYSDRLSQLWLQALRLDPDCVNLTAAELTALEAYLYSHCLIARCQQAAVRVTPRTGQLIAAHLVRYVPPTRPPAP